MNNVTLIGRITTDLKCKYANGGDMAILRFNVAIGRYSKPGEETKTDFPSVVVFGKTAENCEKFLGKGRMVGIQGRLQTGSYEKDGQKTYTTDVIADKVFFLDRKESTPTQPSTKPASEPAPNFSACEMDIPF